MNASFQAIGSLLGDDLEEPVLVPCYLQNWKVEDCSQIATLLIQNIETLPREFLLTKPVNTRSSNFREFFVVQESRLERNRLPCLQVVVTEADALDLRYSQCTLGVNKLYNFVTDIKRTLPDETEQIAKLSAVLHLFIEGAAEYVGEAERLGREEQQRLLNMAAKDLPASLQPTIRPFDTDAFSNWLDHVQFTSSTVLQKIML